MKDHEEWLKHTVVLKDYVDRKVAFEKQQKEKETSKKEEHQHGGLFGGLFSTSSQPHIVESTRPVKPVSRIPKLQGLYLYGGPGNKGVFE